MTKGKNDPNADGVQSGTWPFIRKHTEPTFLTRILLRNLKRSCSIRTTGQTYSCSPARSTWY
jgi:hypothetical protein